MGTARNRGLTNLSIDEFQKDAAAQRHLPAICERKLRQRRETIVVPSEYLRGIVEGWGVPRSRISVILNGTVAPAQRVEPTSAAGSSRSGCVRRPADELERRRDAAACGAAAAEHRRRNRR